MTENSTTTRSVTDMSDEDLKSQSNVALWMAIGITLAPLVPYALASVGG